MPARQFDQAAHARENKEFAADAARANVREARSWAMQRNPNLIAPRRQTGRLASALMGLPFFGWLFGGIYRIWHGRGISRQLERHQALSRLPAIRSSRVPAKVMRDRFGRRRVPGHPGRMAFGVPVGPGVHGKGPNVLRRRRAA